MKPIRVGSSFDIKNMEKIPILKFEYYEQVLRLKELERDVATSKARMGAIAEGRLDKYEDSAWEFAQQEEFNASSQLLNLKYQISKTKIVEINEAVKPKVVRLGVIVKLKDINKNVEKNYFIGSINNEDRLSINSPLAHQLLGKKINQEFKLTTPGGSIRYSISEIKWGLKDYLEKYLSKYIQKEITNIEKINSKISLNDPRILTVPADANRESHAEILQKKNFLNNIGNRIEYVLTMINEYDIKITESKQCKLILEKIKNLFEKSSISYSPLF